MRTGEVAIHRVRARCPEETEPLHARLRLAHLLSTADFQPAGLPPNAILLLRHLRAPRPLALGGVRVGGEWEQALRSEIHQQLRQAARPVRGRISADANAVLFTDMAELLACLGLLVTRAHSEQFWVWQSAIGAHASAPDAEGLARFWRESPRFLPAALRHLEAWEECVNVLQSLQARQSEALFAAVAGEFTLPFTLSDLWGGPAGSATAKRGEHAPISERADSTAHSSGLEGTASEAEPNALREAPVWLTERLPAWSALPPAAQGLLALSHVITRAASQTECRTALRAIRAWRNTPVWQAGAATAENSVSEAPLHSRSEPRPAPQKEEETISAEAAVRASKSRAPETPAEALLPSPATGDRSESREARPQVAGVDRTEKTVQAQEDRIEATEQGRAEHAPVWDGLTGIPTRLAGILYLLNLFLRLDAPACFDAEFALSAHLTLWGLAEGFGRALLEDTGEELARDPLWNLLAQLDGRLPGAPIAPHLPDRERVLEQVYDRLRAALRERLDDAEPRDLLRVPGTLYVTRVHVDLVMALDSIWMPARRAGLDISPGWLPELMRVVLFHYV